MTLVIKIESTPVFYADKFILIDGRNLPPGCRYHTAAVSAG